jgi:hypothetical protein
MQMSSLMDLRYCGIQIRQLDIPMMDRAQGWTFAELSFEMMDAETGGYVNVTAKVPVRANINQTIAQVRRQAAENSVALMRAVTILLENNDPEKLVAMMYDREEAERLAETGPREEDSN